MNLLPKEDQIKIKKQYTQRVFAFLAIIVFLLSLINIILIFPSYLFIKIKNNSLKNELEIINKKPVFLRYKDAENSLVKFNEKIEFLKTNSREVLKASSILKQITEGLKDGGVSIDSVAFEQNALEKEKIDKIRLTGKADTRVNFLRFIKNLEENNNFSEIESPASNILKNSDISYTIIVFLK